MGVVITLTTDFGLSDAYVAEMKGVILGINPDVQLVDVCHTINPQNIAQAAFVLSTAYRYFPERTIHLVVVDPGVGSQRRAILLHTPFYDFLAPDNGVLSYVLREYTTRQSGRSVTVPPELEAISLNKPAFWRSPVSATFHGRDIFAPVAARLSLGMSPAAFGERANSLVTLPVPRPGKTAGGAVIGQILHIDNFGNLITSVREQDLPENKDTVLVMIGGKQIFGLCRTYQEGSGLLALIGSHGYLEISLKNGSAAGFLGMGIGDQLRLNLKGGGKQ
ncbi:MAG: SAM-dependent chlorinase/fluorinase [Dehalococcoidia bacterium]|nr:SAM-dependent chlorinase/fluorinase [Dehalococcoidia bacterium]